MFYLNRIIWSTLSTLESIKKKADGWAGYGYFKTFVLQYDFASEIAQCKAQVDDRIKFLEVSTHSGFNAGYHTAIQRRGIRLALGWEWFTWS